MFGAKKRFAALEAEFAALQDRLADVQGQLDELDVEAEVRDQVESYDFESEVENVIQHSTIVEDLVEQGIRDAELVRQDEVEDAVRDAFRYGNIDLDDLGFEDAARNADLATEEHVQDLTDELADSITFVAERISRLEAPAVIAALTATR